MDVGLVIHGPLDERSGGYLYDRYLVDYLRAAGDTVTVYSLPERFYPAQALDALNGSFWYKLANAPLDLLLQDELTHLSLCVGNYWLRSVTEYPIVSIVHHLKSDEPRLSGLNALIRTIEARYLRSVDGFICNSTATRRSATAVGGERTAVVAYPGGDRLRQASFSKEEIVQRTRAPGPLRLLFVGNVIPRKGLHTVVEPLAGMEEVDWTWNIAGSLSADPSYVRCLRQKVEAHGLNDRIQFLGRISDATLRALMQASHLFLMPSTHEGFGIAYLEAFSFGIPVIASDKGGHTEFVNNKENSILINANKASEIQKCINQFDRDRDYLLEMSIRALDTFRAYPSWDESAQKVRNFITSMIEDSHAGTRGIQP